MKLPTVAESPLSYRIPAIVPLFLCVWNQAPTDAKTDEVRQILTITRVINDNERKANMAGNAVARSMHAHSMQPRSQDVAGHCNGGDLDLHAVLVCFLLS